MFRDYKGEYRDNWFNNTFWPLFQATFWVRKQILRLQHRCGVRCLHKADIHDCPLCVRQVGFFCCRPVDGKLVIIPDDMVEAHRNYWLRYRQQGGR